MPQRTLSEWPRIFRRDGSGGGKVAAEAGVGPFGGTAIHDEEGEAADVGGGGFGPAEETGLLLVVLTDGRANIALDGTAVRARAEEEASAAAKAIGHAGIAAAFVDISPRPRPEGAALAAAMGARYLPLPRADAAAMHRAVRTAQDR